MNNNNLNFLKTKLGFNLDNELQCHPLESEIIKTDVDENSKVKSIKLKVKNLDITHSDVYFIFDFEKEQLVINASLKKLTIYGEKIRPFSKILKEYKDNHENYYNNKDCFLNNPIKENFTKVRILKDNESFSHALVKLLFKLKYYVNIIELSCF